MLLSIFNIIEDVNTHFFVVSNMIGTDWTKLASLLDLVEDIDVIDSENSRIFDKALVVLSKWKKKFSKQANVKKLVQVLKQLERADIVNKIKMTEE